MRRPLIWCEMKHKLRIDRLRRALRREQPVRFTLVWPGDEMPELDEDATVIQLRWIDEDEDGAETAPKSQ